MIEKIHIVNFKRFRDTTIDLNAGMNIVVGDNESGKTTLLEALYLALTGRIGGKQVWNEIASHLFNRDCVTEYVADIKAGKNPPPPELVVDLFLTEDAESAKLRGTNNSFQENCPGVRVLVSFNSDYASEYREFLKDREMISDLPCEYYKAEWLSFAGLGITYRSLPVGVSMIDASRIRLRSGSDYHLQRIISESLSEKQRVELTRAYRNLKTEFSSDPAIELINQTLNKSKDEITDKDLSVSIDISSTTAWESNLATHLDDLPFSNAGSGEQNMLKILLALARTIEEAQLILIEEPENHLSYSSLNRLIGKIQSRCAERQIVMTTHSSYVINKLGLEQLLLLNDEKVTKLGSLSSDTQAYFKKLPGYDTLRVVLAKKVILVEGPSDELIVQRAFIDRHGCRPIERGVDVISVRGLSFKRFLDIAVLLGREVVVITDNDGDSAAVDKKYADYKKYDNITISSSNDETLPSLEEQIVGCNDLAALNAICGAKSETAEDLKKYMKANKTDCALAIFDAVQSIVMPAYISEAVNA